MSTWGHGKERMGQEAKLKNSSTFVTYLPFVNLQYLSNEKISAAFFASEKLSVFSLALTSDPLPGCGVRVPFEKVITGLLAKQNCKGLSYSLQRVHSALLRLREEEDTSQSYAYSRLQAELL